MTARSSGCWVARLLGRIGRVFVTVWKFVVKSERVSEFEEHYGPDGSWAALFRQSPGYVRTELFRGDEQQYITIDYWVSADAFRDFRDGHAADYERLDAQMQALTEREEAIATTT